jgi:hypothetical protein
MCKTSFLIKVAEIGSIYSDQRGIPPIPERHLVEDYTDETSSFTTIAIRMALRGHLLLWAIEPFF